MNTYIVVKMEDVHELMKHPDFDEHCHLVVDPVKFGPSAYMCEVAWLRKINFLEVKS